MTSPPPKSEGKVGDLYWHVHHKVLCEPLTEPVENRITYIRQNKPAREIEIRLRLMKPVRGKVRIPTAIQKADADRQKAYADLQKADADLQKAYADWWKADADGQKAYADWRKSPAWKKVEALHAKECPGCPWNGSTIFPEVKP